MQVRRLVVHNVDFECLLESVPGWNKGVGTEVVRQHVRWSLILPLLNQSVWGRKKSFKAIQMPLCFMTYHRTTIEVKPKFQMFTEQEVLENLVIAQVSIYNVIHSEKNVYNATQARKSVLTGNLDSLAGVAGRFGFIRYLKVYVETKR